MSDYAALMDTDSAPDLAEIIQRQVAFSSLFNAHLVAENRRFEMLRSSEAGSETNRLLDEHAARMREMFLGHSALIHNWPPRRITEEWPAYCKVARAQRDAFLALLAWEEATLHPLLGEQRRAISA
ncbi:MAG: hypothetical protein J7494_10335 [Sphingobium sp.]|nr:hypothetical protein [Sphingobium sp.]